MILSRYSNFEYVISLPFRDFIDLYLVGIKEIRIDKAWIAYVIWHPDMSFETFSNSGDVEEGVFIDQIGL